MTYMQSEISCVKYNILKAILLHFTAFMCSNAYYLLSPSNGQQLSNILVLVCILLSCVNKTI